MSLFRDSANRTLRDRGFLEYVYRSVGLIDVRADEATEESGGDGLKDGVLVKVGKAKRHRSCVFRYPNLRLPAPPEPTVRWYPGDSSRTNYLA